MQPQKIIIIINILINLGEIKHFVAQQMQNCLWQGDVQPLKIIYRPIYLYI